MLNTILFTQAALFAALSLLFWAVVRRQGGRRARHMAIAAAVFSLTQLVAGVNGTLTDLSPSSRHAMFVVSGSLLLLSLFAFTFFLADYQPMSRPAWGAIAGLTLLGIALLVVEKPHGTSNPIPYDDFAIGMRVYLIGAFGALALAFLRYAVGGWGLMRVRMLCLATGFLALGLAGGLSPRAVLSTGTEGSLRTIALALRFASLSAAPLLYIGLTPPRPIARLFGDLARAPS